MSGQIKNTWRSQQEELFAQLSMVLIFGVLGSLFMLFIVKVGMSGEEEKVWFLLGTVMAVVGCVMVGIIIGILGYASNFNMMVSMGRTRKEFYITNFAGSVINNFISMAAILVFLAVEKGFGRLVYRDVERYAATEHVFLDFRVIMAYVLGMAVLRLILGALFLKFGNKLMWFIWGICILIGIFSKSITKAAANKNAVFLWLIGVGKGFFNLPEVWQAAFIAAIGAVLILLAWLLTRKRAVTV
ncbi:MAG: hypothetical protein K2G20_05695 [Lachnospiraceae bacterium]|nr:hypothetical protein [Lachnospiraceae bacterium]